MNAPKSFVFRQKTQRKNGSKLSGMLIIILLFSIIGGYKMYLSNRTATPTTETATITNETDFEKLSRVKLNPGLAVTETGMREFLIGYYMRASEKEKTDLRARICPVISDFPICDGFNSSAADQLDKPHVYDHIDFGTRAYNAIDRAGLTNVDSLMNFFKTFGMGWKVELPKIAKGCGRETILDIERSVLASKFGRQYLELIFDNEEVATIDGLLDSQIIEILKQHSVVNIYDLILVFHQDYWEGFDFAQLESWGLTQVQIQEIQELVTELLTPGF